jgi:lipopolysaccharide export LptBFGC system permease protein LptF
MLNFIELSPLARIMPPRMGDIRTNPLPAPKPVILDTSFRREAARTLIATIVVVLTVVMTWLLFRILRQSGQGQIDPKDMAAFIGLSTLGYLPLVLTVALFVTLILVLIRWYRDSEMAIWFTSGMGIVRLIKPVLQFSWPVLLAVAALTLLVWPCAINLSAATIWRAPSLDSSANLPTVSGCSSLRASATSTPHGACLFASNTTTPKR